MSAPTIGTRITRLEDEPLLRGRGRFVDDISLPGVWHAAFVRSPHPHALITSIDQGAALAVPGVRAVLTLDDIAPVMAMRRMVRHSNSGMPLDKAWPFALADGEVCYVGEPVAMVIADDRYIAEDAAALVTVDYEPLGFVADVRKAKDSPPIRRELKSNVITTYKVAFGDVDAAFAKAAHVFKQELWQHRGAAHSIETRGTLAELRAADGGITVHSSTQKAHDLQQTLTSLMDFDQSLRVVAPDIGGGFGAKLCVYSEDVAVVAAAKLLGRSIKWTEDRREYFTNAVHERDQYWQLEIAVDTEAKVLGVRGKLLHDTGAYTIQDPNIPYNSASTMSGPYVVPGLQIEVTIAMSNKTPVSSVRGAGYPQAAFAMERLLDLVAREMKLDRAEVRRRNLIPASKMPYKKPLKARSGAAMEYDSGDYPACQAEALKTIGWDDFGKRQAEARAQGRYLGIGLAHGVKGTGRGPFESGLVRISRTGKVTVFTGASAMGQGLGTAMAQIAAAQLGVERRQGHGDCRRHLRRLARARRLRQPADRHRGLVGASGGQSGGGEGEEGRLACAGGRRERPRAGRRRGARARRAATERQARRDRPHPAGRAGLRLSGRRRSRPRSHLDAPHGRAQLRQRLPRRRSRGRSRDRRGENPALRGDAGLRRADQSDDGRGPDPRRRRPRHRQHVLRMDGLRRRRAAGHHHVRGLSAADRDRGADADRRSTRRRARRSTRSASRASARPAPSRPPPR